MNSHLKPQRCRELEKRQVSNLFSFSVLQLRQVFPLCLVIFHRRLEISLFIHLMNNVEFTAICFFSLRMNHKAVQNFYKASQLITMHASVNLINTTDSLTSVTMSAIRFNFVKAKSNVITTAYQNKKGIYHKKLMKTQR